MTTGAGSERAVDRVMFGGSLADLLVSGVLARPANSPGLTYGEVIR